MDISASIIEKARNDDGHDLYIIGNKYRDIKHDYSKALAWYKLAANQNNANAQACIGYLYATGKGVPKDYAITMDYFLRAAGNNESTSMSNIGYRFLNGKGVPFDKYKALEWFIRAGEKLEETKKLNKEGIHLREEDKDKTVYQLINETEDIRREERERKEELKKKEIESMKNESKHRINLLEKEKQKYMSEHELLKISVNYLEKRLKDKEALVQSKNTEIDILKKENQKYNNLKQEIQELKRKMDEYRVHVQNAVPTNDKTTSNVNNIQAGNQNHHGEVSSNNVNGNIRVKREVVSEDNGSWFCQIEKKKRKVVSNDS
ncbi:HCP-like protein [Backusella circina FSU 941]|nr:HCP-like protein [Backusella circina FSU 941]